MVSIIVPVYNVEKYLPACLDSLAAQTMPKEQMEVLLINDGSPDGSAAIAQRYAAQYGWIRYFSKENEGLSATRNYGIARAKGKYLLFLDSDDSLAPETVQSVVHFFDKHADEVDLVAYPDQPYQNGQRLRPHFRYRFLPVSGVYDLNEVPFALMTRVSVAVKNRFAENVLFDTNPAFRHEDQKYCTEVVSARFKIGYCNKGEYRYNKDNAGSIVATYFYAYYIFESTIAWFESLFAQYEGAVPRYVQALLVNDLNWKTKASILLPTHYAPAAFAHAKARVQALLQRVDTEIILTHPEMDPFHAQYFLQWKYGADETVKLLAGPRDFAVARQDTLFYSAKRIELFLTKFKLKDGTLRLIGFLKSPVFNYTQPPQLFACVNGRAAKEIELPLRESSWSYYKTKEKTNRFWGFLWELPTEGLRSLSFSVLLEGNRIDTTYGFLQDSPFQPRHRRASVFWDGLEIRCEAGTFYFKAAGAEESNQRRDLRRYYFVHSRRILLLREAMQRWQKKKRRIWLYYDCAGVRRDNAYEQFRHDFPLADGIERYYVVNDDLDRRALFDRRSSRRILRFGSKEHKRLFLQAEKVITAFIEPKNYIPFSTEIPHLSDYFRYDLIYLQHGVLHAHLPWKYSLDRLNLDKEVISTHFERQNLIENYGFSEDYLLPTRMPRYDHIDRDAPAQKKILLAPSWRKYLVGMDARQQWTPKHGYFLKSDYFRQMQGFLNSPALAQLLERYDYTLEFQLHPILAFYREHFQFQSPRVRFSVPGTPESDYAVFLTDISSFVFDFAYLRRAILYFVPDLDLFHAGMNDYSALDMPLEDGLGPLVTDAEQAVEALGALLANDCQPQPQYREKTEQLFLETTNSCDQIYRALIAE
jgi:glycosyltransferase involved in cell wall biosynthesis